MYFELYFHNRLIPQASQAHVTSVLCEFSHKRVGVALQATVETLYEKKKTVLRSANANIISFLPFFYKINEGDLPLMYSCVLWCEFVDVVGFLAVIV